MNNLEAAKKAVGIAVVAYIEAGMRVGLGTGSTAAYAIAALGQRVHDEALNIFGMPTSFVAEQQARRFGIPIVTPDEVDRLDVAFDGADEVDPHLGLIKGRGAAQTREKIVATLADRFIVLVDATKLVDRLGSKMPVPVEVLPMALVPVMRALSRLGAEPKLRMGLRKDGPVVTDQGFWVVDAFFKGIESPEQIDQAILKIPGVLDHGLFLGIASDVLVGEMDGRVRHLKKRPGDGSVF